MVLCESERLLIRQFQAEDAKFIVELLNQESFIRYIADKQVRTEADAIRYLEEGPWASYQQYGFGLNVVQLKGCNTPIGMCGLLKRPELDFPDLGYAFLPQYCGQGYALEAAQIVLHHGFSIYSLNQVLAVTLPENLASNRLLQKAGFRCTGTVNLYGSDNNLYQFAHDYQPIKSMMFASWQAEK
ncbi:GNAT family N-acetyltransferase [uncultured Ferrimonas sp.]|uniref:GNAT family N-acetyltransferase n=1 Tax=uncultured Ferrimonas sp. TaxID=432640 RepID=UPI002635E6CF|nr:GNAT family N-acetyltransferase [uncultured Ferrimonas sp.]